MSGFPASSAAKKRQLTKMKEGRCINGHLALLRNYDEFGNRLARPKTLLIDSEQLESGDALDADFREIAGPEIEQFKRELIERTRDATAADKLSDQDLLREVMNTVGKTGRLGESIRCVVSVSMLSEGWDANTVTHILGVRAFGTQLLCEQVVGRGFRRQSYDLNEEGLFEVEYADVLGIPFDFTAKPVVAPPKRPKPTVRVHAVKEREALEITFPRVEGYRVELPEERIIAKFSQRFSSGVDTRGSWSLQGAYWKASSAKAWSLIRRYLKLFGPARSRFILLSIFSTRAFAIRDKNRRCIFSAKSSVSSANGSTKAI